MTTTTYLKENASGPRFLVTGDPTSSMIPEMDTTLLIMHELLKRGYEVDYCDLYQNEDISGTESLRGLTVQQVLFSDSTEPCFIGLAPKRQSNAFEDYGVILHRKDPPVDDFFIRVHTAFAGLPKRILQINDPTSISTLNEHELPLRYPKYAAETFICNSFEEFVQAVRKCPGEAVCKPHNECSGLGIEFYNNDVPETILKQYWVERQPKVIVQPFLSEINDSGDLRVLMMNGAILGSVLRVPAEGSRLANLHRGGKGVVGQITDFHRKCAQTVYEDLAPQGIYLIGLDFIGENLTEVNITSPTTLPLINKLMGTQGQLTLVDEIENLRKALEEDNRSDEREISGN